MKKLTAMLLALTLCFGLAAVSYTHLSVPPVICEFLTV